MITSATFAVAGPAQAAPPEPQPTTPPANPVTRATQPVGQAPDQTVPAEAVPDAAKPIAEALATAKKSGRATPVPALTDAYSTTTAGPDGTFATTYSVTPQRVNKGGKWTAIDTTLVRRKDGSYAPRAAAADVSFGGGKTTDLVSLKSGGKALRFTWLRKLPEPTVVEDTATYANVLPDVDLQVTANATGYSSIFVLKTREAAENADVRRLSLGLNGGGLEIAATGDGGAEAADPRTGRTIFRANTALMWDSTPTSDDPAEAGAMARALSSPKATQEAAALYGRNRARAQLAFGGGKQTLTLDNALLIAKTTKYPVFVDPDWGVNFNGSQSAWARISSNGWNVYNSTATSGAYSPRFGLDDWPDGDGERARSYYKINTAGIKGATVKSALMYFQHRWSASCYDTAAVLYATGTPAGWTSSTLNWGKEPSRGALLGTQMGRELNCGTSKPAASPSSFAFDVTGHIQSLANAKKDAAYFLIEAKNMNDKYSWKQLQYKGGASLTVRYSYAPTLNPDDGLQHVFPSSTDSGKVITTSRTPTLRWRATNRFPNGIERNLMIDCHVEERATGRLVTYGYGPGATTYNKNGSDWTVPTQLPDGEYRWRVTAKNADGLWAPAWGPYMYFTVDLSAPNPPTIKSTQFPQGMVGDNFTDKGRFLFGTDGKNNVKGYMFTLDGDLNGVVYNSSITPWTASTTITRGAVYYAKADNNDGTGTVSLNGTAAPSFAPGIAGTHIVRAKAVDQAGSTSAQTEYGFTAGTSTPVYAYGDGLHYGWTATNSDGTTTEVPKATTTSTTGYVTPQPQGAGYQFVHGVQAMLSDKSTTSKVASGDSAVFSFNIPQAGVWEIGANLTTAPDYGRYALTIDDGRTKPAVLTTDFDAYSTRVTTVYKSFGLIKDASNVPIVLGKGVHTLTLKLIGKNAASGGYQAGIDVLRLNRVVGCPINDTKDCLNSKAISTYTPGATPPVTEADADGWGWSLNAGDFRNAGWTPGGTVTAHGAAIKLPPSWGDGTNDNMLAAGQLVTVPDSGVVNKGNAVVFLGFSVNGDFKGATGRITYAKDSGCNVSSQAYTIDWMPDWAYAPTGNTVLVMPTRNKAGDKTYSGVTPSVIAISVPLVCPGARVASVSLPLVSNTVQSGVNSLHILGLGIRPVSSTGSGADKTRWVGSWAAAQDTGAVQSPTGIAKLNAQTLRIPAHLSIGSTDPGRVRVRLANSQGTKPITFDAASIALQDPATADATAMDTPVPLTFGGATAVTLPAGTDVLSDPIDLTVPDQATVLVSLQVRGLAADGLAGHGNARSPAYVSASDGVDHTGTVDGGRFTRSTMTGIPFLAGVDVSTPADDPKGALVLYGDQTVNSDTAAGDGLSQLSDHLATALSSDEYGTRYPIRTGVLNLGSSSQGNKLLLPRVANRLLPENAYGLVDRDIISQTNARIVLISAGTSDLLTCTGTADTCANTVNTKLNALAAQLQQYRTDDALDHEIHVPSSSRTLKVYVATLPPFAGAYTAAQEAARQLVNAHIMGGGGVPNMGGYADGAIDFAAAVTVEGTATVRPELLSGGSPNDLYYQSLALQYAQEAHQIDGVRGDGAVTGGDDGSPVGEWLLNGDGTDTTGVGGVYHDAQLTDVTWSLGRRPDIKSGTFNGSTSRAVTGLPLNTAKTFTVTAWVRLTDRSQDRNVFVRDTGGNAALYFQYRKADDRWLAQMPSAASGDTVVWNDAVSNEPPKTGVWTHLAAVYDASVNNLALYVDGKSQAGVQDVHPFHDPNGTTEISGGRNRFAGDIAEVRVWQRALLEGDLRSEVAPRQPVVSWQFENQSSPATATDSSGRDPDAPGTFTGGVTWKTDEGHPNPAGTTDGTDKDRGAITLNGTSGAVTTRARLRTDQSFTVAAWARLTDDTRFVNVVGQSGTVSSGFQLNYGITCKCWRFVLPTADGTTPVSTHVQDAVPAALNTWTHLAAVYDAAAGTAMLYVNGKPASVPVAHTANWNSTGAFTVGRARWNNLDTDYFKGDIDDVVAYQEALTPENIDNLMRKESP
ncbi:LamG-like jellyroll fold domain-containing protein [Actinoplanes sp. NPDC051861]|uniref:LamG-like jellyroll fold domain-containing protein n=1 Tax=Actinoplanes sp. NPDC051861 TaxID=3155170 RepID=UPI00341AF325